MIEAGNLWQLIERRAAATPETVFAIDEEDRSLDFAAYRAAAERCAAGLLKHGVREGTAVSWMLPTWIESLVLVGALARLGAVQNPILPIYREREVGFITRQTGAELLIVPPHWRGFDYPGLAHALAQERSGLEVLISDHSLPEADPASLPPAPLATSADDAPVRWIFYTSGTTADPKGAQHTDLTLMSSARGMSQALQLEPDDRVALVFPFTHVGGIGWLFAGFLSGCAHILVQAFDPKTSIGVLARNGVTQATAGTAFHQAYLATQREAGAERVFPRVRSFPGGGAPKPPQLHYDLKTELGGVGIVSGYGMTECPILAMNSVDDPDDKLANTEGRASPAEVEIRVVRGDASLAGPNTEGELRVRGPQLFRGYLDAALNDSAFDEDGFFRTGDLGQLDEDGFVVITGRLKDVIIRKGENISAREVEDLLYSHPKIADVGVIGLPDPNTGERCCAVVSCSDASDPLDFAEMVAFLKERGLMLQKIPEQLELIAELPRNPTGKILKDELRKRYS
ncbi:MAG: AMP-binding protein [bacterium]|nr:AMP-binding protein [bacterium]